MELSPAELSPADDEGCGSDRLDVSEGGRGSSPHSARTASLSIGSTSSRGSVLEKAAPSGTPAGRTRGRLASLRSTSFAGRAKSGNVDCQGGRASQAARVVDVMPARGWHQRGVVHQLELTWLHKCRASIDIRLRQTASSSFRPTGRTATLLELDSEIHARIYGTPRCFGATHTTARVLTRRNRCELPTMLHFDIEFAAAFSAEERSELRCVAPSFVEWLMGAPAGWTSRAPIDVAAVRSHAMFAHAQRSRRYRTLSLFSGCGLLDLGLRPWCEPIAYCECAPDAVAVLEARMADGVLPRGPVLPDVRLVSLADLPSRPDGIVGGFPCVDVSGAGHKRGASGEFSKLLWECIRLADSTSCSFLFLENVDNLRYYPEVWRRLLRELDARGFLTRWVSLSAESAGSPQRRRRWFALATRGAQFGGGIADPVGCLGVSAGCPGGDGDAQLAAFVANRGVAFNSGRPPVTNWMLPIRDYARSARARLRLLGNAVVPMQAYLAARVLSS